MVSAGWWVPWSSCGPPAARPYIGGSTDNTVLNLALGYNGVDRIVGGGDAGFRAPTRISAVGPPTPEFTALFSGEMGYEISWLLPAVRGGHRRRRRTSPPAAGWAATRRPHW